MKSTLRSTRRFFIFLMTRTRRQFVAAMGWSVVVTLTEGVGVVLLLPMLKAAGIDSRTSAIDGITRWVERFFAWIGVEPTIEAVLVLFALTMVLHEVIGRRRTIVNTRLHAQVAKTLRTRLFAAIASTRWAFFVRERQAEFARALTADVDRTVAATASVLSATVSFSVGLLYLMLALYISLPVTLLVAATGAVIFAMLGRYLRRSTIIGKRTQERANRLYALATESLIAMKAIKSYDRVDDCVQRFDDATSGLSASAAEDGAHQAEMEMYYKIGAAIGLCVIVYAAVRGFALPTADLFFLLVLFARVMPKLAMTTRDVFVFASHVSAFDAIEVLRARCVDNADPNAQSPDPMEPSHLSVNVSIENVTFAYDSERPVLDGVSLDIPACSVIALVGASGAGKTTLLDVILGLLPPDSGKIRLDGTAVNFEQPRALRSIIGYVGQETVLFNSSIRDNLLWAAPEASDSDIQEALKMASATFVNDLEQGLETPIGDRGALLSGGQRQRLSLARALLRRPELLILDEATSALDREHEEHIMAAMHHLRNSTTVLIVSHRANAVRGADKVYVLDEGRIIASGPWSEVAEEVLHRTAT